MNIAGCLCIYYCGYSGMLFIVWVVCRCGDVVSQCCLPPVLAVVYGPILYSTVWCGQYPGIRPLHFTRILSQFDLYTFYFMYFYRYLVSYKTNILEKSKETVNVCCWDLRLYFMFCSFVISFGCLESSPEKPDFFKSGVKGANGHQGSCLNFTSYYKVLIFQCLLWNLCYQIHYVLWIIYISLKIFFTRRLKMVR